MYLYSWILHFRNTQIGMYSMPKLHKHLFKMEFSLATLRSLNFIPSLKNMVWLADRTVFLKESFIFILDGKRSFLNPWTFAPGIRNKSMVEDVVILTYYTRALHVIILLKYQLNKNLDWILGLVGWVLGVFLKLLSCRKEEFGKL